MSKPHWNNKSKSYNRYTHTKKKQLKHNTKDGHQITRVENKRGREEKGPTKPNSKTLKIVIGTYISIIT